MQIENPILPGFNPDPSILRVGDDFYIATSTFEWFPGVQIHHSKDLRNWRLAARPLSRISQLDLLGNPDSCGVWAPCLTYDKGVYYLVYSNVRSFDGLWKDTPNYLVTTKDILGEWSDPVFLSSTGFDASLFHDDNGKKYYTSLLVDHRKGKFFGGITLQEFDSKTNTLIGPVHRIFDGTELGFTEGPHLYKKDGYYYLITAEGGTEYGHAVSMARSKKITGPYEVHPDNPIITSRYNKNNPLQKAGHADLVQTPNGDWYAVFLTGRPLTTQGRCTLGRETSIEKVEWRENGWLYLSHGGKEPGLLVEAPDLPEHVFEKDPEVDFFVNEKLNLNFQSLRVPVSEDWLSLKARKGFLRLTGRESLSSLHRQSLIARRVQHFHIQASTCVEVEPVSFQQMAGLVAYYNTCNFHYLHITSNDDGSKKLLNIVSCQNYQTTESLEEPIDITGVSKVYLKVDFNKAALQFYYAVEDGQWKKVGPVLDGSTLSDDYVRDEQNRYRPAFTGAFVGMCCQDLSGKKMSADFDWFSYKEIK